MKDIYPILRTCSFFDRIPEERYPEVLSCLHARRKPFRRDSCILNIGDQGPLSGLVLSGTLEVSFLDENGSQINVNHIPRGKGFGMAMVCSRQDTSSVRLRAITDCEILFLDFTSILVPDASYAPFMLQIASNLLRDTAQQTVFLKQRIRIMGQKRLRDKIKVFLQYQRARPDGTYHIPFKRSELAEYLYADRSALSRELGRMSEEGILKINGHDVQLLDSNFLKS